MNRAIVATALAALCCTRFALAGESDGEAATARPAVKSYGQALVDRAVTTHPELLALDLHAKLPDTQQSMVIASNQRDRVGRRTESRELAVVETKKPVVAVDEQTGQRIEVGVPLQDRSGNTIGAVQAVYAYDKGQDEAPFVTRAEALSGEMQRHIPTLAQLGQPLRPADGLDIGGTQSLPTTKQIVSGKALAENEQDGYAEAIKHVAGVSAGNSKGSANDSVNIRGIKLNLFSNYRLNGGLPVAGVITMPVEDKARLETLKGANALQFGVASPAGIINMITKRAGDRDVLSVSGAGSSFGQYGGAVDVGHRFGDDKQLGVRVNASATHLENGVRDLDGHGEFASVGTDYRASDRLTLQGDFEWYRKRVPEQAGISLLAPVKGVVPITAVPDPRNLLSGAWAMYTPDTINAVLRADYLLADNVKLVTDFGRSWSDRSRFTTRIGGYDINTGANGTVSVSTVMQDYRNSFGRMELQSRFSTWAVGHQITAGGSITDRRAETPENRKEVVLPQKQNIYDPIVLAPPAFAGAPGSLPLQISRDGGVYVYDTLSFHPRAPKLLVGLRYTQDYENNGRVYDPVSCPKCGPTSTWVTLPALGAMWDVIPGVTMFGSYMEGLEAGATAPANAYNANEILASAVSTQKEVGVRGSFQWVNASLSLFDIDRANAVTDPSANAYCNGHTMCFVNSGEINYKGIETTVNAELGRLFTVDAGWQWLRSVQHSPDAKFNGLAPENTPKAIGNLRVGFHVPWVSGLTLSGGGSGVTSRFVNFQQQGTIPGYVLYSAGATWTTAHGVFGTQRLTMLLNIDNLTNLRYWNSVQTGTYGIGMDRSVRLTLKMDI